MRWLVLKLLFKTRRMFYLFVYLAALTSRRCILKVLTTLLTAVVFYPSDGHRSVDVSDHHGAGVHILHVFGK